MATNGFKAEKEFIKNFFISTVLTPDWKDQKRDIDAKVLETGTTISIKSFGYAKTAAIELYQEDPTTGQKIKGAFGRCEADFQAWKFKGGKWYFLDTKALKDYLRPNIDIYPTLQTRAATEEGNKSWGKGKWRRSYVMIVEIDELIEAGVVKMAYNSRRKAQQKWYELDHKLTPMVFTCERILAKLELRKPKTT